MVPRVAGSAALNLVEAFMQEVLAQRGREISSDGADNLLDFAGEIAELLSEENRK